MVCFPRLTLCLWVCWLGVATSVLALAASFISLGYPNLGENDSSAAAVSGDGTWVTVTSKNTVAGTKGGFRWSVLTGFQALGNPPGKTEFSARGISTDGRFIAGDYGGHAYRWQVGVGFLDLGTLPGLAGLYAGGISGDGSVVVGNKEKTRGREDGDPFRWTAGTGMVSLGELPGGSNRVASAISAQGQIIVSWSYIPSGEFTFRWTQATEM